MGLNTQQNNWERNMEENKDKEKDKEEITEEVVAETLDEDEAGQETPDACADSDQDMIASLQEEKKKLEEEVASLKDRMLRNAAETENYKKRLRQDKENAVKYANESLIRDLLDPLDNFSRAIEAAEKSQDVETIKKGVVHILTQSPCVRIRATHLSFLQEPFPL